MPKRQRGGSLGRKTSQATIKQASRSQGSQDTSDDSAGTAAYATKINFDQKAETHTAENKLKCKICGEIFKNAYNLKRHHNMHTSEKSFDCSICKETFVRKDQLEHHIKSIHKNVYFKCSMCIKDFKYKTDLDRHVKTEHVNESHK